MTLIADPHRRWNPLKQEWVLVSPHRTDRPWQGQSEVPAVPPSLTYDPSCYLCPGNLRAGGHQTPVYTKTFVFDNDYAALKPEVLPASINQDGLLVAESEPGICRVICFSPRHDLTLAGMEPSAIRAVVDVWTEQADELGRRDEIAYVQIFENRGAMMGASNPHPHGQIWATHSLPNEIVAEGKGQAEYVKLHGRSLLPAYLELELKQVDRIVLENEHFVALVPYWAVWPFETLVLPREPAARLRDLDDGARDGLADLLKRLTSAYNAVFDVLFPYSMGVHGAPDDGTPHPEWQMHLHFYPPLLRSATVRKFMVGFELLASPQRDITPESAAETLRQAVAKSVTGAS